MDAEQLTQDEVGSLRRGDLAAVKEMVARGVRFDEPPEGPVFSALHRLFYIGDGPDHPDAADCIRFLVEECGTPPNRVDEFGKTEFHLAIRARVAPEIVATLLELGADPNFPNRKGGTPLSMSLFVKPRQWDSAILMVDAGGDLYGALEGSRSLIPSLRSLVSGDDKARLDELGW